MKHFTTLTRKALLGGVASLSLLLLAGASHAAGATGPVEGLWKYTGLTSSSGKNMPLTGIFLLADGKFLQQAVFNGEPYARQQSMAHTGTYKVTGKGVQLKAGQTLGLAPAGDTPLSDAGVTEHDLEVSRDGEEMTLVFGSGTVQNLERMSDAAGADIYPLEKGMLAFTDGNFVLVNGDSQSAVTGYGTYRLEGKRMFLEVIRWSEGVEGLAQNLRDVSLTASFDGRELKLADGRVFPVKR